MGLSVLIKNLVGAETENHEVFILDFGLYWLRFGHAGYGPYHAR